MYTHLYFYFQDWKRIELYKLNNVSSFNVTGEIETKKNNLEKNVTLKVLHAKRKIVIDTIYDGRNIFISKANFTLRPGIWGACGLHLLTEVSTQYLKRFSIFLRNSFILFTASTISFTGDDSWENVGIHNCLSEKTFFTSRQIPVFRWSVHYRNYTTP